MSRRRAATVAAIVVAVLVVAAVGIRALWAAAKHGFSAGHVCHVGAYDLDTDQASVAATMVGAVTQYRVKLPERATVLVLGAALQESKLINVPPGQGDRDSVGVLQQRPSQGWGGGSATRLTDVTEATKEFLDALVKVPNWQRLPLAEAVQAVQISADGSLYAQHEPEAQVLADVFSGRTPAGVSCSFDRPTKVATTTVVAQLARKQLGLTTPQAAGSQVVVPGAGWQTTAWFVAYADRLGIDRVSYAGKTWSRAKGWQDDPQASTARVVATMYVKK